MYMNLGKLREIVRDREAWPAAVPGVSKSRIRLGDWTTTVASEKGNSLNRSTGRRLWRQGMEKEYLCLAGVQDYEGSMVAGAGAQSTMDRWLWWNLRSAHGPWRAPEVLWARRTRQDVVGLRVEGESVNQGRFTQERNQSRSYWHRLWKQRWSELRQEQQVWRGGIIYEEQSWA